MKKTIAFTITAAFGLSAYSCNNTVATTAQILGAIISHSHQACSDLQTLGAQGQAIAAQVAAANPNNTSIQRAVGWLNGTVIASNSDCQTLAASFTAEAPKSALTAEIKIDQAILDQIK